jgi:hypothetical protein
MFAGFESTRNAEKHDTFRRSLSSPGLMQVNVGWGEISFQHRVA